MRWLGEVSAMVMTAAGCLAFVVMVTISRWVRKLRHGEAVDSPEED